MKGTNCRALSIMLDRTPTTASVSAGRVNNQLRQCGQK